MPARVSGREIRKILEEVEKFEISEESKALILEALAEELMVGRCKTRAKEGHPSIT